MRFEHWKSSDRMTFCMQKSSVGAMPAHTTPSSFGEDLLNAIKLVRLSTDAPCEAFLAAACKTKLPGGPA